MQIHVETVAPISIPFIKDFPRDYRPKGPFRRPIGKDSKFNSKIDTYPPFFLLNSVNRVHSISSSVSDLRQQLAGVPILMWHK